MQGTSEDALWLPSWEDYKQYVSALPPVKKLPLPDRRDLTYRQLGAEDGYPVVLEHGNPGSSASFGLFGKFLEQEGVRGIAIDRAGSGGSTRHEGLYISDTARDVEHLLNSLEIRHCGLVAVSGGVPHGLGCLALLGKERITACVGMAGLAPLEGGVNLTEGMIPDNQKVHHAARDDNTRTIDAFIDEAAAAILEDSPFGFIRKLLPDLRPSDIEVLSDRRVCSAVAAGHAESLLSQGGAGWYDDIMATHKPWVRGGEIENIVCMPPTIFWHGKDDGFAPAEHAFRLASRVSNANAHVVPGAHFSRITHFPSAIRYIMHWAQRRRQLGDQYW